MRLHIVQYAAQAGEEPGNEATLYASNFNGIISLCNPRYGMLQQ